MKNLWQLPLLSKEIIQTYVGENNYYKGEQYVASQAIRQGKVKNHLLTALCQGNEFDPYRVEVIFNFNNIQKSHCSCPVGAEGKCKHVAALLLSWAENPENFTEWNGIKTVLNTYDVPTLVELIDLLDDKVESSSEIIRAFRQNLQMVTSPRLARYIRRIEDAFHVPELPWYHQDEGGLTEIAFTLDKIRSDADLLIQEGQWEEAVRIDQTLVQQILNHLDEHQDPWGNLSEELKRCIHSLDEALTSIQNNQEIRLKIFQTLFRLIEEQIYRKGDIGVREAKEVILKHMNSIEQQIMVKWVEALQKRQLSESQNTESLEDFLIDLQKDQLDPDVYLSHYRQTGQIEKLVKSLLALGRIKEAEKVAKQKEAFVHALALATSFVIYKQPKIAEKLVLNFQKSHPELEILEWLKSFYQDRKQTDKALEQIKKIFFAFPTFLHYQQLKQAAALAKQWAVIYPEAIKHVEEKFNYLLLIQIYLDENALEKAIAAFEKSTLSSIEHEKVHYYALALTLADTVQFTYPLAAISIYEQLIDSLIKTRQREDYRKASEYLRMIRSLYEKQQKLDEWNSKLEVFMKKHHRLKALKDEMRKANLIETEK